MAISNLKNAKNNQLQSLGESENNHNNECKKVYETMVKEKIPFTCHEVSKVIGYGTNASSRIFRKLEANGLIKYNGDIVSEVSRKKVTSYIVVDYKKEFVLTHNEFKKVERNERELAEIYVKQITKFLLTKPLSLDERKKCLSVLLITTDKFANNRLNESTINLFLDGCKQDTAFNVLKYLYIYLKNK